MNGRLFSKEAKIPWAAEWQNMPECSQSDLLPKYQVVINFSCAADVEAFAKLTGMSIRSTDQIRQLRGCWFPAQGWEHVVGKLRYKGSNNPRYPIFIPSKGRADTRHTMRLFDRLGVPYTVFVEAQEYDAYAATHRPDQLHVLPHRDKGLTVTRNYIWDYAQAQGYEWFWTFDDNIQRLYRLNCNQKISVDATPLAVIEDFVQRYENIAIAGMNYEFFITRKGVHKPYQLNTRIYSNMLIRTNAKDRTGKPYRNVTFYNDDTDLCLRVLKDRWCTVLFNAFLIKKITTMVVKGGMTDYYEKTNKRLEFAQELQRAHPGIVKITEKWGRWHHHVDYSGFTQQLKRKLGVETQQGVNNFGMVLQEKVNGEWVSVKEDSN